MKTETKERFIKELDFKVDDCIAFYEKSIEEASKEPYATKFPDLVDIYKSNIDRLKRNKARVLGLVDQIDGLDVMYDQCYSKPHRWLEFVREEYAYEYPTACNLAPIFWDEDIAARGNRIEGVLSKAIACYENLRR